MASKPKLPAQIYITAKHEWWDKTDPNASPPPHLGFLNAYEPGKASFEKKKITQDEWAYKEYMPDFKLEERGSKTYPEWWVTGSEYEPWVSGQTKRQLIAVDRFADPQPQIWTNDPLNGFRILRSVSRYSTSN